MEEWKDIKGYEGLYRISNYGRVLGIKRGSLLKHSLNKVNRDNYYTNVGLSKDGVSKTFSLKKLVYEHFIGYVNGWIDHKDGDYGNCGAENLIVVHKTFKFKKAHATRVLNTNNMKMYDSIGDLAKELNVNRANVKRGIINKYKKYSHYKLLD